jgi:phosphatidylethanolamine-binding protein (PEBP) family uncharacterized protein
MERSTVLDGAALASVTARILGILAAFSACSGEPSPTTSTGGAPSGGTVATTGGVQTGGVTAGGTVSTGGTISTATGGANATGGTTGGTVTTGGTNASGGTVAGGTTGNGGLTTGGTTANGGASSGGSGMGGSLGTGGSSAGASSGGASSGGASGAGGTGGATGAFTLTSPTHAEGAKFASKFTCADAGFDKSIMPELKWTAGPAGTKSYAITFIDTSLAPANMNGYHWVVYNIPPSTLGLPENFRDATTVSAKQSGAFLGPCPNFMSSGALKTDNYEFTLYALATDTVTFTGSGTSMVKDAESKLNATHLAAVKLKGTSDAKWPK